MSVSAEKLLHQAMQLSTLDRAALVEGLITSLDKPDPSLDALWLKEAESRIAAYHAGELEAVDAEEAFAELGRQV
jgi:putative addiction module component (TIGR02574 family)